MNAPVLRPLADVTAAYEAAGRAGAAPEMRRMREAADEFSGILYRMLMKQMRATVEKTGLLDGGQTEEVFRDFLDGEYAKEAAGRSGGAVSLGVFEQALDAYEASARSGRPIGIPALPSSSLSY